MGAAVVVELGDRRERDEELLPALRGADGGDVGGGDARGDPRDEIVEESSPSPSASRRRITAWTWSTDGRTPSQTKPE